MKAAKSLIDSLFMFETKQNDLDPNLLYTENTEIWIFIDLENTNDPECFTVKKITCENINKNEEFD